MKGVLLMTINQALSMYLKYCERINLSSQSLRTYKSDFKTFTAYLEEICVDADKSDIKEIDRLILKEYFLGLQENYSVNTVKKKFAIIGSFYTWLVQEREYLELNPMKSIKLKQGRESKKQTVAKLSDVNKIMKEFDKIPKYNRGKLYYRDKMMIHVLYGCGIRVNELINLKYSNYDETNHSFKITAKGNKSHIIFLTSKETLNLFEKYKELNPPKNDYVFSSCSGKPVDSRSVRNMIGKWCKRAGIETNLTPHSFRRGCATSLIENGVDISRVKTILGHADIQTTMRYVALSDKAIQDTMFNYCPMDNVINN